MEIEIKKLDHKGRGIGYIGDKIVFVPNALPGEKVNITIIKDNSKYMLGKVFEYIEKSTKRVKSKCPFFLECGGCHLRHMNYTDTLKFKEEKIKEILFKYARIQVPIEVVKCDKKDFYRNKIEIKIVDGRIGFYRENSHELIEIDRCINAEEAINSFLLNIDLLHINNGEVTIKSNYNGELILIIKTLEEVNIDIETLRNQNKLVGIVLNDKVIFGVNHFIEIIDKKLFKESYNSFFQTNRTMTEELFKIIDRHIEKNSTILDLCSGVGTLSLVASSKAKKVYGIEIVENAVLDAILNSKMNKCENVNFMLGDAFTSIDKIADEIDTFIMDPPRNGLTKEAIECIKKKHPQNIIYVSCDPVTLSRDLYELLEFYDIYKYYLLDMFPYTYHVESVCLLSHKKTLE